MGSPNCPRCGSGLQPLGMPVGVACGCSKCGGVLLDDPAFGHVRDQLWARIAEQANVEAVPSRALSAEGLLEAFQDAASKNGPFD